MTTPNHDLRRVKRYQGLIPNLSRLLGVSEPSSNLLFDNIKLRWNDTDCRDAAGITDADIASSRRARNREAASGSCRMCSGTRINYSHHLIYDCTHFSDIRPPSLATGLSTGMSPTDMAEWASSSSSSPKTRSSIFSSSNPTAMTATTYNCEFFFLVQL